MTTKKQNGGQTLIVLLVFMVVAIAITTASAFIIANNSRSVGTFESGLVVHQAAEGGVEVGLIKLIRDTSYTGESLTLGDVDVTVNVTGTNPYTVDSTASWGDFVRQIEVVANYPDGGSLSVSSWEEIN